MTLPSTRLVSVFLASLTGGFMVSCTSDTAPDGNIFLSNNAPRYGHGGTDSPRYKYGANETATPGPRGETKYLNDRRPVEERPEESSGGAESSSGGNSSGGSSEGGGTAGDGGTDTSEAPPRTIEPSPEPEKPEPAAEEKPKPPSSEDIPYATPVPGQEGKVYSPFHNGGYVDVSGMPSGSKARCPYTKKIFRVP